MKILRQWMRKNKWSIHAMAKAIGISESHLSSVLHGRHRCTEKFSEIICKFTKGEIADLAQARIPKVKCPCCGISITHQRFQKIQIPLTTRSQDVK